MSSLSDLYTTVLRGTLLAPFEKQALCPADIARTPKEAKSRQRVAEVIRCLRREEPPQLDAEQVLEELRQLVLKQTKSLNGYHAFKVEEIEVLENVVNGLHDWSRLVKLLGQIRALSMRRYNEAMARAKQARQMHEQQHAA